MAKFETGVSAIKRASDGNVHAKGDGGGYKGGSKDKDIGGSRLPGIGGKKQ